MKRKSLVALRASQNTVDDSGIITVGTPTSITFSASVQPLDKIQLQQNPYLRDFKQVYVLYSNTELLVAKAGVCESDKVVINGVTCEVLTSESWQNSIRSHYKMIVGV